MITVWLLLCLALVFAALLVVGIIITINDDSRNTGGPAYTWFGFLLLLVVLAVAVAVIPDQHGEALSIPIKIAALERTIEQQTALISDDATLGQGLEGLEVKRTIQTTIRDLNDLIARAEYITISPWYIFKPDMSWRD